MVDPGSSAQHRRRDALIAINIDKRGCCDCVMACRTDVECSGRVSRGAVAIRGSWEGTPDGRALSRAAMLGLVSAAIS
jgi:hypothetical protein